MLLDSHILINEDFEKNGLLLHITSYEKISTLNRHVTGIYHPWANALQIKPF